VDAEASSRKHDVFSIQLTYDSSHHARHLIIHLAEWAFEFVSILGIEGVQFLFGWRKFLYREEPAELAISVEILDTSFQERHLDVAVDSRL
jgi:hypothetical protein